MLSAGSYSTAGDPAHSSPTPEVQSLCQIRTICSSAVSPDKVHKTREGMTRREMEGSAKGELDQSDTWVIDEFMERHPQRMYERRVRANELCECPDHSRVHSVIPGARACNQP